MKEAIPEDRSIRQKRRFILSAIGAVVGFISCVLTITNPIPELYFLILYVATSIAILLIFAGLYFIFE